MSRTRWPTRDVPPPRTTVSRKDAAWTAAQLATLELRAREAQERVAPDRRAVLAEAELGARELVDGGIESTGEPVDEARGVRRPRDLGRVAHPRGIPSGRLGRRGGAHVIA